MTKTVQGSTTRRNSIPAMEVRRKTISKEVEGLPRRERDTLYSWRSRQESCKERVRAARRLLPWISSREKYIVADDEKQQRKKTLEASPTTPARPPHPQAIGKLLNQHASIANRKPGVDQRNEIRGAQIYYNHNDTRLPETAPRQHQHKGEYFPNTQQPRIHSTSPWQHDNYNDKITRNNFVRSGQTVNHTRKYTTRRFGITSLLYSYKTKFCKKHKQFLWMKSCSWLLLATRVFTFILHLRQLRPAPFSSEFYPSLVPPPFCRFLHDLPESTRINNIVGIISRSIVFHPDRYSFLYLLW